MKVLIAEDDEHIRAGLAELLRAEGYETVVARNGREALEQFRREAPDFVCLDIMMPGANGYDVCREIRRMNATVPVIFITAKSEEVDKVLGLELGADDYILKPFGVREVLARIRAVTRRCFAARAPEPDLQAFRLDDLEVLPAQLRARRGGAIIDLSLRDVKILRLLYERSGQVVDRDTFFNVCWGLEYAPNSRTLDQHVSKLRKRIERDPKSPRIIRTVHGAGYRYEGGEIRGGRDKNASNGQNCS
jgi:DNA-binding response OmpR family regulator